MKIIDSEQVADALPYDALIDVLDEAFKAGAINPDRTHHEIEVPGATRGTLLLMPCWRSGKNIGEVSRLVDVCTLEHRTTNYSRN